MKPITNTVELAEKIISEAFKDKKDKGGIPYVEHLYRVADKLKGETHIEQDLQTVALLHDLLEYCPEWNCDSLRCLFHEEIVDAVLLLTKKPNQEYEKYIEALATDEYARRVKMADLEDNMDIRRLHSLGEKDFQRLQKYLKAYNYLTNYETF